MTNADPPVVLTRVLPSSCEEAFRAWTEPDLIRRWLAPGPNVVERSETDLRVGGAFMLETRAPNGARHLITGRYREIVPGRRLVQSWVYEGPLDLLPGVETELCVELKPLDGAGCELTLTHRRLARPDVREAYRGDWPTCFDKLQNVLS
ncbi:SRPBCC family protein [Hansschlegelia beijingensis]|uniref:Uncharacterized protein YndB with AHSA1/START domain n=1 Tax=Hansschlegelia beijingensis TaxID=1133344 RepID=A0A7W6GHU2_9HYPH|nr:SRPBCC domain-containing protein [Hansschlegelia beijingensis]MBB3974164.1 uncharacterized protein YndB with AHSA1/START domain [Hansschlegelia beijingensis]